MSGVRVELYRFVNGSTVWTYARSDVAIEHNGETYLPVFIKRTEIEAQNELNRDGITITVDRENPVGLMHQRGFVEKVTSITVFSKRGAAAAKTIWKGRVVGGKGTDSRIDLTCESIFTSGRRQGPKRLFQVPCTHVHYGSGCGLNAEDWAVAATVTAVNEVRLTIPVADIEPDGWYFGGMVKFGDVYRMVVGHQGDQITILWPFQGLTAGTAVSIYPGCDLSLEKCNGTFANELNYGGQPWIPDRNPIGGSIV